jgi:hypothetical protein
MFLEQQQAVSLRSNVPQSTYVLRVNTPCSHLQSVCASGDSSSLATKAAQMCGESIARPEMLPISFPFVTAVFGCF